MCEWVAESCAPCTTNCESGGESQCTGECWWVDGACIPYVMTCGNGTTADTCDDCEVCGDVDCQTMTSTGLCRQKLNDGWRDGRTASVHLNYWAPVDEPAWWFQRLIVRNSSDSTFFATNGNSYGYGGFQEVYAETEDSARVGRVIFSIWDQGCDADIEDCDEDESGDMFSL